MNHSSTSSSEHASRTPGRFALRLLAFCLPLIVLLGLGQLFLHRTSEGWSMDEVISTELQTLELGEDSLFGRMLVAEELRRYKLMNILRRNPKVLVLGTSTVMQFRGQMFGDDASEAYNAGGITQQPEHIRDLLPVLKTHGVKSVLLGVDFWWFNKDWQTYRLPSFEALRTRPEAKQDLQARLFALRSLSKTLFRHHDRLMTAVRERRQGLRPGGYVPIGLAAQLGSGFRGSDGSRRDERFLERTRKGDAYQDGMETLERIARHNRQFVEAQSPSQRTLETFRAFITECRAAGIQVAAVLPPLAPATYDALMQSPDHADFLREFVAEVSAMLRAEQVPHVVATDVRTLGLGEENMMDGLHGSEVAMGYIMLRLLENPAAARVFPGANPAALRRDLESNARSEGEVRAWSTSAAQ